MSFSKKEVSASFQDLRRNYAEVVVSPRVENIPKAYRITILTHALVIGASVAFAFLYTALAAETICQAKALGETTDTTCQELVTRKELFAKADLNTTTELDQGFTIDLSLRMNDRGDAVADVSSFVVSEDFSNAISDLLIQYFDTDGTTFNSTSEVIRFYEDLENATTVDVFPVAFDTDVPDVLNEGADLLKLKDEEINGGNFVNPDSTAFNLVVLWKNEAGTIDCALETFFDPTGVQKARNVITCESTPNAQDESQIVFQWVSASFETFDYDQLVLNFFAFIVNVQRKTTGTFDNRSQKVIKNFFSLNFFVCCAPSSLDTLDYFGIFSGIGFLLEGVFVFVITYAYFGGHVEQREIRAMEKTKEEASTGGLGDEIIKRQKEEYDEKNFTTDKLIRVIFNPRCRYIPFPSVVSFASLVVLLGFSAIAAYYYQIAETQIVCEPTVRTDVGSKSCSPIAVDNHVYNSLTATSGVLVPVGISASLAVEAGRLSDFSVDELYRADAVLLQLAGPACLGASLAACINGLAGQLGSIGDVTIEATTGSSGRTEVDLEFRNTTTVNGVDVEIFLEITTTVPSGNGTSGKFLEVVYEFQEVGPVGVVIDYFATFSSTFERGPEQLVSLRDDGGNLVMSVLATVGTEAGADQLVVKSFDNTFVQCCSAKSLLYFDYWGLMIGFVAMGEGLLTFGVALVVYVVLSRGCNKL